jgi:hypothetical protein
MDDPVGSPVPKKPKLEDLTNPIKQKKLRNIACMYMCKNGVQCTRTFVAAYQLLAHERFEHLGLYDHICALCKKAVSTKSALYSHNQHAHSDARPFKCPECDEMFKCRGAVLDHLKLFHSDKKLCKCEHVDENGIRCKYECKAKGALDSHMQNFHSSEKLYRCEHVNADGIRCKYECKKKCHVSQHMKHEHSDLRPYICKHIDTQKVECEYAGKTIYRLRHHELFTHADRTCPEVMGAIEKYRKLRNIYNIERRARDPVFRLHCNMRSGFYAWMKRYGGKKDCHTSIRVGISIPELLAYLESNSIEGLKYGDVDVDVDHIKPCSQFKQLGPVQQHELWNYRNLQLMSSYENRHVKRDKFDPIAYAASDIGKAIAIERVKWVAEFGETPGPEIVLREEDENEDNAEGDGEIFNEDEFCDDFYDSEDECGGYEEGSDEYEDVV